MKISAYQSIIALNVCRLNVPNKWHQLLDGLKKKSPIYILPTGDYNFRDKDMWTENEGMETKRNLGYNAHIRQSRL